MNPFLRNAGPLAIPVLLVAISMGCSGPGKRLLVGEWQLQNPDQLDARDNGKSGLNVPSGNDSGRPATGDDTVADNTSTLFDGVAEGGTSGTMRLVFHRSGSLETITDFPAAQSHKYWRWSMESWDAQRRVATIRCEMDTENATTTVRFLDDNTIQLVPPNIAVLETELQFVRQ